MSDTPQAKRTKPPAPDAVNAAVGKRLLPRDFNAAVKKMRDLGYDRVDDIPKDVKPASGGFFQFPQQIVGVKNTNEREFLVFYFEAEEMEAYKKVRAFFELKAKTRTVHPILDTAKLTAVVDTVNAQIAAMATPKQD